MASLSHEDLKEWPAGRFSYERHRPEETLLYRIIQEHWVSTASGAAGPHPEGRHLPAFVKQEFEGVLAFGRLDRGFLQVLRGVSRLETGGL